MTAICIFVGKEKSFKLFGDFINLFIGEMVLQHRHERASAPALTFKYVVKIYSDRRARWHEVNFDQIVYILVNRSVPYKNVA